MAVALVHLLAPAPAATAVSPPQIDRAQLPPAASPAPPAATEQSGRCVAPDAGAPTGGTALSTLNLATVWPLTRGAGQVVAVIDTGVAPHRLLPHLLPGGDFVSSGDGTQDCDGHGTAVAGIIAGAPLGDFSGVAPDSTILSIRQSSNRFRYTSDPGSPGVGDVDTLARAVRSAADSGATVINISSVACQSSAAPPDDRALGAALAYAVDMRNVVVVSAAGNVGGSCRTPNPVGSPTRSGIPDWDTIESVVSPAWYDDYVLTVGSVGRSGAASAFSLAGPWVDVAAPGENAVSLGTDGEALTDSRLDGPQRKPLSGTSYAAPVVSGVVALMRSRSPQLTARQIMARIKDTARHPSGGWNPQVGHGVVDTAAAVSSDGATPPAPAAPPRPIARPRSADTGATPSHRVALVGTAACIVAALLSGSTVMRRRPRPRAPWRS